MKRSQFEILEAVEATGSLRLTAQQIRKAPSNVSRAVRSLEEELGCAILISKDRRMKFSPEGKLILRYGRQFLEKAALLDELAVGSEDLHNWTEREIRSLLTIRRKRNLSKAAEELYVSQPSLSQMLRQFHLLFGEELLNWSGSSLQLTETGKQVFPILEEMNGILASIRSGLEEFFQLRKGTVKVGITANIGISLIPQIVPEFLERFPDIKLRVLENNTPELKRMLKKRKVDFCIWHEQELVPEQGSFHYPYYYEEPLKLVIPLSWQERLKLPEDRPLTADDLTRLAGENYILVAKKTPFRNVIERIFLNVRLQTGSNYAPVANVSAKNMETIKRLIAAEAGITFLPDSHLHTEMENLMSFPLAGELEGRWLVVLALPDESNMSVCSREFVNVVEEVLEP